MNLKGLGEEKGTVHRVKILPGLSARHTFCDVGWDVCEGDLGRKEKRDVVFLLFFTLLLPCRVFTPSRRSGERNVGSYLSPHHKVIQIEK